MMQLPSGLSGFSPQNFSLRKVNFFLRKPFKKMILVFRNLELRKFLILQKMEISNIFYKKRFS